MQFTRYGIYYTPPRGALADFGAAWLGWDPVKGRAVAHPEIAGLPGPVSDLTETPRKYGFHGTIKPPFRLAPGTDAKALATELEQVATTLRPVSLGGLEVTRLGGFLALTVTGPQEALADMASTVVRGLDHFRAPPSEAELARRRKSALSPRQEELLATWGYPYVMDEFRFHMTLTGKLGKRDAETTRTALAPEMQSLLPAPFVVSDLTLVGEDTDGLFHEIHRYSLSG
ncbi:DUF1045 domain-containing protein [Shimia sp. SDUM112013]|uniref:DUF1045 domain-containing protein n=1 Tax=Shimia sp. SDUM112013 TaxID=3136160 RepID=UPI0032EBFE94